uniref:disease resistance protein RPV1-like n=1 Tax=Erigeron canadensis TaxID=72917 RepID=UPI001CB932AF|nr:disease resistance protein RPV1-like [Erigeron canadensis]
MRINKGKRISDELNKSIEDSKLYVIVFSKNYASSSWCLDELVKIMECQKKSDRTAYPVFYDVDPSEVRNQSGSVGAAFAKHIENIEASGKWRDALKEASNLAGWELKNTLDGHEAKFIKKIVEEIISLKLRFIDLSVEGKLIGMESRVNDVVSVLDIGSDDVRMIGIKGMGGAGKTTLARAVFDHISIWFEGKSFVENVREVSKASLSGLKKLQEQIMSDVLNDQPIKIRSVHDGKNIMKKMMCGQKVLVVLDDVDNVEQLEALAGEPNWFNTGSRIIITTRDEQVLVAHQVDLVQDVNLLSHEEALCLFSRYAFGKEIPIQRYKELSDQVVCYAAGLPLTIRVLGSFLCGKNEPEWKDAIERLKEIPLKETLEKLELSYTGLEDDYKEIFLDVACILKGWGKDKAIEMLESCGFRARIGLKVLEQKSLITISTGYEVLEMHDHIEEMGKNIVRRLHPDDPNKHSRLWIYEEIGDILVNDLGTEATRCIIGCDDPKILLRRLRKMKKLRYLGIDWMDGDKLDEDKIFLPNSLRFVNWYQYPSYFLLKQFEADNLVGLRLEGGNIKKFWEGKERKVLSKLKFLNLNHSRFLETLDLEMTPNLETLYLEYCECLQEIQMPVGGCMKLKSMKFNYSRLTKLNLIGLSLETLSLRHCYYLEELNIPFPCPNLKSMDIYGARNLRTLDLRMTPNLERLDAYWCSNLVGIQAPVGCLKKLVYVDFGLCRTFLNIKFDKQIESHKAVSLAELNLSACSVDECPLHPLSYSSKFKFGCVYNENPTLSLGNLGRLISAGFCRCTNLESFLKSICGLRCLRKLTLNGSIPEAPKHFDRLECLEELVLSDTYITHLPDNIRMLKHLKSLKLDKCSRFEKLPEDFGQLQSLEELILRSTVIKHLPDSLCMLKQLKSLKLISCCHLEKLPEDFGQLESLGELVLSGLTIKHLPNNICMLKKLKTVKLGPCWETLVEEMGRLECLEDLTLLSSWVKHLPDSFCNLKLLKSLRLDSCRYNKKLIGFLGRLEFLEKLSLSSGDIWDLPDSICKLKHLKTLQLTYCPLLKKLPDELGRLECLQELDLTFTPVSHLPDSISRLKGLRIFGYY